MCGGQETSDRWEIIDRGGMEERREKEKESENGEHIDMAQKVEGQITDHMKHDALL